MNDDKIYLYIMIALVFIIPITLVIKDMSEFKRAYNVCIAEQYEKKGEIPTEVDTSVTRYCHAKAYSR